LLVGAALLDGGFGLDFLGMDELERCDKHRQQPEFFHF
jgi:hypothetical protein